MDERTIRAHLAAIVAEIERLGHRRRVLERLRASYQELLQLLAQDARQIPLALNLFPVPALRPTHAGGASVGGPPRLKALVLQVINEAEGRVLHARDIWDRARARGATTKAADPARGIDV